jgi:uncharacterized protein
MKVGIVGSGIAGLAAARELATSCSVTVFESENRVGGHVYTVPVSRITGEAVPMELIDVRDDNVDHVDMGFIVCNRENYPLFFSMLRELGVPTRASSMSFSVNLPDVGMEWSSRSLAGVFAQRRRLISLGHWRFIAHVLLFLRQARQDLRETWVAEASLDEYLAKRKVSTEIRSGFVVPLAAALWSLAPTRCGDFPALTYLRFLQQHGMLDPVRPLGWETVVGGSQTYVRALTKRLAVQWQLATPVHRVERAADQVVIHTNGMSHRFDHVIIATHADVALSLLDQPTESERSVLGAFRYSDNQTVLHRDMRFMPNAKAAHASWNYLAANNSNEVTVTYSMNHLQGLPSERPYLVTLNPHQPVAAGAMIHQTRFRHPQFTKRALQAQSGLASVGVQERTHYAGAYAGYGFHEDGMRAGVMAARRVLASGSGA